MTDSEIESNGELENYQVMRDRIAHMKFTAQEEDFIFTDWQEHITWLLTATREEIQAWVDANIG